MNLYEITFSPTGGTERVAKCLSAALSASANKIDLTDRAVNFSSLSFTQEDVCLVSVPSFAGRVPAPAAERIRMMQGNGARAVAVVVYGNRAYDDTFLELTDTLTEAGFRPFAAVAAIAEHSILRRYAAGRPDENDLSELTVFGRKIAEALATDRPSTLSVPGNRPYRAVGPGVKPFSTDACRRCGVCAKACPVGAIPKDNPADFDKDACFSCMRCLSVCPVGARILPSEILAALDQRIGPHLSGYRENELFLG